MLRASVLVALLALASGAASAAEAPPVEVEASVALEVDAVARVEVDVAAGAEGVALEADLTPGALLDPFLTDLPVPLEVGASSPLPSLPSLRVEASSADPETRAVAEEIGEGEAEVWPAGGVDPGPEAILRFAGAQDPAGASPVEAVPDPVAPPAPLDRSDAVATLALGVTAAIGALAALYSRFQKHTLLRSPARATIQEHVATNPGATLRDLAAATGLSRGALVHHCQMLEKHGLVASRHDGLHRRFFLAGARGASELRPPTPKEARVILLVQEKGPLTQAEMAAMLGVSRQAMSEQVKRLHRDRRLVPEEVGRERRWAVASDASDS